MAAAFAPADSTASSAIRVFPLRFDWSLLHLRQGREVSNRLCCKNWVGT